MSEQTLRLLRPAGHGPDGPLWSAVLHGPDGGQERVLAEQLGADLGALRRIGDAAQLQARHPGPAVVQARALLRVGAQRFLIVPMVQGPSLAERLDRGPLPLSAVLEIGAELAGALAELSGFGPGGAPLCPPWDDIFHDPAGGLRVLHLGRRWIGGGGDLHPTGPAGDVLALSMSICALLRGQALPPLLPDPETWDLRVEDRVAACVAEAGPLAGDLQALLLAGLAAQPERRLSLRALERGLFALRGRLDAPPLRAHWPADPLEDLGAGNVEDVPMGAILIVDERSPVPSTAAAPAAPLSGAAPAAAPAPTAPAAPQNVDEVLDPAEVEATIRPRRAARPPAPRAELPTGAAPADPSATFVGDRKALLEGLNARQDTEIRAIPKALQRGRPDRGGASTSSPAAPFLLSPSLASTAPGSAARGASPAPPPPSLEPFTPIGPAVAAEPAAPTPAPSPEPLAPPRVFGPAPSAPLGELPPPPAPPAARPADPAPPVPAPRAPRVLWPLLGIAGLLLLGAAVLAAAVVLGLLG